MNHGSGSMTIVQLSPQADRSIGDYVYRIQQPAEALGRIPGIRVVNLTNTCPHTRELCLAADVLVLHLIGEHNLLPVLAKRKELGLPTVYEISDNFLALPSWVPFRRWFTDPANLATTFQLIRMADAVQGVSGSLLDQFAFLNEDRMVFENQILDLPPLEPAGPGPGVMGWAGSLGHTRDVARIAPVVLDLCQRHEGLRFAFMGNRDQFEQVFGPTPPPAVSHREPGSLTDYYAFLEGLDIGLAPLEDTAYNLGRSDVKFIEYASRGAVPVVSDLGPYRAHVVHGGNGFLFEDPDSLTGIMETLLADPDLCSRVREAAYQYVRTERREHRHASPRAAFYERLIRRPATGSFPWHLLEKTSNTSEVYRPVPSTGEAAFLKGTSAASRGRRQEALDCWLEAVREEPGYDLAHVSAARAQKGDRSEGRALEHYRAALSANPNSLQAFLHLGRALEKTDAPEMCRACEQALEVFPDFAPAWHLLGCLERDQRHPDEAVAFFNRALEANPFYAEAAYDLARALQTLDRREEAMQAYQVALELIPDREDYQLGLVRLLEDMGDLQGAVEVAEDFLRMSPGNTRVQEAALTPQKPPAVEMPPS